MARVRRVATISASPDAVWSYLAVPAHWAVWDPDIVEVLGHRGGFDEGGEVDVRMAQGMKGTLRFSSVEPLRRLVWEGRLLGGSMRTYAVFELTPEDAGRATRFVYEFEMRGLLGPLVDRINRPLIVGGTERGLANLVRLVPEYRPPEA